MKPYVKICGITNRQDALFCAACGADALGFIFYRKSPRYVSPSRAASIIALLPPHVLPVGVFVNASRRTINRTIAQTGIRAIQLSGDESPQDCESYALPVIKAFRVCSDAVRRFLAVREDTRRGAHANVRPSAARGDAHHRADPYGHNKLTLLLDGASDGQYGGTGRLADFAVARELRKPFKLILAGGLTPRNVADAIRRVKPFAVDVCSGVESAPGQKDHAKVRQFIQQVRRIK